MKNVIVITAGSTRYAIELRWVREVVTLGFVTPVPGAPDAIVGVVSIHGTVTPVIELPVALGVALRPTPEGDHDLPVRRGDGAIVIDVDNVAAAIHVANVEEVSTLWEAETPGNLVDSYGRVVATVDCPALLRRVHASAQTPEPPELEPTGVEGADGG